MSNTSFLTEKELRTVIGTCAALWKGTQKDGFGYACVDPKGCVHGERFLNPDHFYRAGTVKDVLEGGFVSTRLIPKRVWNHIGSGRPVPGGAIVIHGRNATGDKKLESVHPFVKRGWVLTHNGVVDTPVGWNSSWVNHSDCDSEDIINAFAFGDGVEDVEFLEGWAALFILTPTKRNLWAMRCNTAPLHASWMGHAKDRGTYILASDADHIREVGKKIKIQFTSPIPVNPNTVLKFHGKGREDFSVSEWEGLQPKRAYTYTPGTYAGTGYGTGYSGYKPSTQVPSSPAPTAGIASTPVSNVVANADRAAHQAYYEKAFGVNSPSASATPSSTGTGEHSKAMKDLPSVTPDPMDNGMYD